MIKLSDVKKVPLWVPRDKHEDFKRLAKALREKAAKERKEK